jgi:hypothetical protein
MNQPLGALLMVTVDIDPENAADLNDWYEEEHFPEKLAEPGYRGARLYVHHEDAAKYVALYDLDDSQTASPSPEHRKPASERSKQMIGSWKAWTRGVWDELPCAFGGSPQPAVLLVLIEIDPSDAEEFDTWYVEHLAEKVEEPGFVHARRFRSHDDPGKYLTVYELEAPTVAIKSMKEPTERSKSIMAKWKSVSHSVWTAL